MLNFKNHCSLIVIYLSLRYSISSQLPCLFLTAVQLLTVSVQVQHELCSFRHDLIPSFPFSVFQPCRLGKRSIRVNSQAFFSHVWHPVPYKLCKEPSKAQIKKTFPILLSTTLFNLSNTLSYFSEAIPFYHFLDPIILAFWQFTHIQDLVHYPFNKNKRLFVSSEGFSASGKNAVICSQRAMLPIQSGVAALCRQ